jgi:glycerol-3-phosphate dehydrogenase
MAERVVDEAARRLAPGARPCRTAEVPLVENGAPIAMARTDLEQSDIAYSIEEECALTVSDVLERRARANLFSPQNGVGDAPRVAAALAHRRGRGVA